MKKILTVAAILLTVLVLILGIPTEAVSSDVLYVSDAGSASNTGLSPEKALNSLTDAIAKLPATGGTVVLCGDVTIDETAPVFTVKTGKVTVTGSYAGVDYDPTVILATSGNMYMQFQSEIEFNNLTFDRANGYWCEFVTGPKLIIGEGVEFTKNGAALTYNSVTMMIRLGYANVASSPKGKCETAYLEMHSGTVNYVHGGNKWYDVGVAVIKMYGSASVTDHVQCGGTNKNVDSVSLTLNGVTIPELYIGCYGGSASQAPTVKNVTVEAVDSTIGKLLNAREVYGSSTGAAYGTLDGTVSLTLDNTCVDAIDMTDGTIAQTADISLTLKNQDLFAVTDGLSWVDSLTVSDDSFVYVDADYAGPATVTVAEGSTLLMNSTLNAAADIPAGATLAHKYVMTLGENGSYTLTCTDENCGPDTVTKTAGELKVVYLDGTATTCGDGSLASNPVNSLAAAYARLSDNGGTIVVMNGFTVSATTSHQVVEWPTKTGKVTLTGKYGGISYGATITFDAKVSFSVQFRSPIEFNNLTFNRTYAGSSTTYYTQFATGPDLTFGEGMVMLRNGATMDDTNAFVARCGYAGTPEADLTAKFTMMSGTLNFVQGGNSWRTAGSATIYIGGTAKVLTHVQAGGTPYPVNGDVSITIDGASVAQLILGGYQTSKISGNVSAVIKNVSGLAVIGQRSASGTTYGIGGNLSVSVENSTLTDFSLADLTELDDVTVSMKTTTVSGKMDLGGSYTISGDLNLALDNCNLVSLNTKYDISGNMTASLKDTTVSGSMYLGGKVTGAVDVTLDNTAASSDLQYVQDANATSYALTLKNTKNLTSNSSFDTVDSLTLENSSVMMAAKYEGPATITADEGSVLYVSGSLNQESELPAVIGEGRVVYLAVGAFEKGEPITMRYDDRLDVSGYSQVIVLDKGTPTSYQVGHGVEANTVLDSSVVTYNSSSGKLVATGIGTATVVLGDKEVTITVEPAPLSLFLMIGQSNMAGSEGDPNKSVVCEEGQVYSTWGMQNDLTTKTGAKFVPSALAGQYSETNTVGTTEYLSSYPLNLLTADGAGKQGMDGGFGYEWTKLTGEKVWLVNAAHGGTSMGDWIVFDSDTETVTGKEYRQLKVLFNAVLDTMTAEVKAGHYTLENYAYYWCQGCADRIQTADWYLDKFSLFHETMKQDFARDFGDGKGERTFESANIVLVRACGEDGMNSLEVNKQKDYMTYHDLEMNGVRIAQYYMANSTEDAFKDVHMVCNIGDQWVWWDEERTVETTKAFFAARYPNGIDYPVQVGTLSLPTKPDHAKDSIHYNQVGYNEVGRETARNSVYRMYPEMAPDEDVSIKLYGWDGVTDLAGRVDTTVLTENQVVVPVVYPLYRSKELVLSGDMLHDYSQNKGTMNDFVYYAINGTRKGTVTATLGDVSVSYTLNPTVENKTFRWETVDGKLVAVTGDGLTVNALTLLTGTNENGLSGASFQLAEAVVLRHDQPWRIEWQGAVASPSGGAYFLLASSCSSNTLDAPSIIMSSHSVILNRRLDDGTRYIKHTDGEPYAYNYFRHLRSHKFDTYSIDLSNATVTYALVNEVTADGNMVWLYVNGQKVASLSKLYDETEGKDAADCDEISGKDYVFGYIGAKSAGLSNVTDTGYDNYNYTLTGKLNYMQIEENRLNKIAAKQPTETEDGNVEYYIDPVTGKLYLDANGANETTLEEVTLSATGPAVLWGDADGNGEVDIDDANIIKQYRVGLVQENELNAQACDVSGDGQIDVYDAYLIQIYLYGTIQQFPVETQ